MKEKIKNRLKYFLNGFIITCVVMTLFITFLGIMLLVNNRFNIFPSQFNQILWMIIMGIASIKIGISLRNIDNLKNRYDVK